MWKPEDKESKDERLVFVKAAKRREFLGLQKQNDEQSESNKTLPFLNFCEAEI